METEQFQFDAFMSHSSHDKSKVARIASRLRDDGVRVWYDDWNIAPGEPIPLAIEDGLQDSRVLVFFISNASLASEWASIERHAAMFRDPANKSRRFVPVLLDDCTKKIPDALRMYRRINLCKVTKTAYAELLAACRRPQDTDIVSNNNSDPQVRRILHLDDEPETIAFIPQVLFEHLIDCNPDWFSGNALHDMNIGDRFASCSFTTPHARYTIEYEIQSNPRMIAAILRSQLLPTDVVILDAMIQYADGRFANDGLAALDQLERSIPIENRFVITAYPKSVEHLESSRVLPRNIFGKPFDPDVVARRIAAALSLR